MRRCAPPPSDLCDDSPTGPQKSDVLELKSGGTGFAGSGGQVCGGQKSEKQTGWGCSAALRGAGRRRTPPNRSAPGRRGLSTQLAQPPARCDITPTWSPDPRSPLGAGAPSHRWRPRSTRRRTLGRQHPPRRWGGRPSHPRTGRRNRAASGSVRVGELLRRNARRPRGCGPGSPQIKTSAGPVRLPLHKTGEKKSNEITGSRSLGMRIEFGLLLLAAPRRLRDGPHPIRRIARLT